MGASPNRRIQYSVIVGTINNEIVTANNYQYYIASRPAPTSKRRVLENQAVHTLDDVALNALCWY